MCLPSPVGRGCPATGAFTSRSGTGEGLLPSSSNVSCLLWLPTTEGGRSEARPTFPSCHFSQRLIQNHSNRLGSVLISGVAPASSRH
jgi:hypothetical protein